MEYNTFILGAGFSKAANLPLGDELMTLIIDEAKKINVREGYKETLFDNIIQPDLDDYIWYKKHCGIEISGYEEINLEDFISYLDIEHFLGLKGKDTWSEEGNRSQILIRNLLSKILFERQQQMSKEKLNFYDKFVKRLKPYDVVITFNYDTVVESALERNDIPFRYHWDVFKKLNDDGSGELDLDRQEVVLLKLHGSIDWFSKDQFDRSYEYHSKSGHPEYAFHTIFRNEHIFDPVPIIKGKIHPLDPLKNIFRCNNMDEYFRKYGEVSESPYIISPSYSKLLYMDHIKALWDGFYSTAMMSKNFVIIGFSLPSHDEYIRLPLFRAIYNFQQDDLNPGFEQNRLKIVDYKQTEEEKKSFKQNFSMVNESKTDFYFEGFDEYVVEKLLENLDK